MVNIMARNNSFYKGSDFLNEGYKNRMSNYFNPYEYNFESNLKDKENNDKVAMKSNSHEIRKNLKK